MRVSFEGVNIQMFMVGGWRLRSQLELFFLQALRAQRCRTGCCCDESFCTRNCKCVICCCIRELHCWRGVGGGHRLLPCWRHADIAAVAAAAGGAVAAAVDPADY